MNQDQDQDQDTDELNLDWLDETNKLSNMETNYEPEPMDTISAHFVYVNVNNYIEKIKTEKIILDTPPNDPSIKTRTISKEFLLKLIQNNQLKSDKSKYYLTDIMWYNVELTPENIQKTIYNENSTDLFKQYFKTIHLVQLEDIVLPPSIFIFHSLNSFYFVYQEREIEMKNHHVHVKSILKTARHMPNGPHKNPHTKKVHIDVKSLRKSRKGRGSRFPTPIKN